jgi:hypothetical protein
MLPRGALADLEALESGYLPGEIEMGDHQASPMPLAGCQGVLGLVVLVVFLAWRSFA